MYDFYKWKVPYRVPIVDEPVVDAIVRVMKKGVIFRGDDTTGFEEGLAAYIGVKHGVSVNAGTSAQLLYWLACGYEPGSEIISQTNSYIAGLTTAMHAGLKPVFVEPDKDTFTIDVNKVEAAITPKTRALLAVHLYGHPTEMGPLMELCDRHGVDVFEVIAHSTGGEYGGRKLGSFGRAAMSTFGSKVLTVNGLGGMLLTNDEELAKKVSILRKNARETSEEYLNLDVLPYNLQLSECLAAIGGVNLKRLDAHVESRRHNAARLRKNLLEADLPIIVPIEKDWGRHAYLHFVIRSKKRDALKAFLIEKGIEVRVHYPIPAYLIGPIRTAGGHKEGDFPISDEMAKTVLSLPVGPWFTDDQIDYVADQVKAFFKK